MEDESDRRDGTRYLNRKSRISKQRASLPAINNVLIVEDNTIDANRLRATLHALLGYEVAVRGAATLASALDQIMARQPDVILLDDILGANYTATDTMPILRHAKYTGPIIVVSAYVTRTRRIRLIADGAIDVIHKDDVHSTQLAEAIVKGFHG